MCDSEMVDCKKLGQSDSNKRFSQV